jgi:hypothetical protein
LNELRADDRPLGIPVNIQQIIERLLRARLYRTGVEIEMDSGEAHRGLVEEVRYDGSRSVVIVARRGEAAAQLLLAHIVRVGAPGKPPRHGAAA